VKQATLVLLASAVLATCLSACSGPTTGTAASPPESSAPGAVTTQAPSTEKAVASNPGTGIINSTTMASCATDAGKVAAVGTVTLPEGLKGQIKVSVSWVDTKTSTVLAKGDQTIKDAKAGKTTNWSISADLPKTDAQVRCVLGSTVLPS
jgi:hypothetical protein